MRTLPTLLCCLLTAGLAYPARAQWSAIEVPTPGARPAGVTPAPGKVVAPRSGAATPAPAAKADTQPITDALPNLLRLRPVRYTYQSGQGESSLQYGLRPAELAKVYPELVRTDLLTGQQTINTSQLLPILVEAVKEQQLQLQQLQAQHLQLAQAYAELVRRQTPAGPLALLRRPRPVTTDSTATHP